MRQGETVRFFPHDHVLPGLSPHENITRSIHDLIADLKHPHPSSPTATFGNEQTQVLIQLARIMQLALPVQPAMTQRSGLPAPPQPRVHTAPPLLRVPTAPPPPRVQLSLPPPRLRIPTLPPWPRPIQRTPPLHIPTVTPPPSQTCNLTIAPSRNTDPYYADLLPHQFANTVMNRTTGMEARISDLFARRVEGQDGPTWSEATCR